MHKDGYRSTDSKILGGKSNSLTKSARGTIHTLCTTNGSPYQSEWGIHTFPFLSMYSYRAQASCCNTF